MNYVTILAWLEARQGKPEQCRLHADEALALSREVPRADRLPGFTRPLRKPRCGNDDGMTRLWNLNVQDAIQGMLYSDWLGRRRDRCRAVCPASTSSLIRSGSMSGGCAPSRS